MLPTITFPVAWPFLRSAFLSLLAVAIVVCASAQTGMGRLTGVVTNSSGNAFLEGATVMIEGTGRTTLTDRRGEYDFGAMPPGEYSLRIGYTGMSSATARVIVTAGQSTSTTTALREDAIIMGEFTVVTNRSADALAITDQRHAPNVKNVVDINAYGMLSNDNPGELLQLLPGVNGTLSFGEVDRVSIRGMDASLNTVQLDGNSFATPNINQADNQRSSVLSTTNTNNIKTAEVIKAITPDRPADAIGGIVNLIQKTALDYPKSAGRFEYRLGGQYQTTRSGHEARTTPNLQLTYHDVFGPKRNWGVYATGGFNKEVTNQLRSTHNIASHATFVSVPVAHTNIENQRFRYRKNYAVTLDHRPGFGHEFVFKYRHEDWLNFNDSVTNNYNAGVPAANWTPLVRTYATTAVTVVHNHQNPRVINDAFSFDGKHRGDAWELTYTAFNSSAITNTNQEGSTDYGANTATLLPAFRPGLVVDATQDALFPSLRVTGANPDAVYDPDNYQIGVYGQPRTHVTNERTGFRADFKRAFATALPVSLKAGVARTDQSRVNLERGRQRAFVGEDGVLGLNPATGRSDDRLSRFVLPGGVLVGNNDVGNRRPPVFDLPTMNRHAREQPRLWLEDTYGNALRALQNNFAATEIIDAAYIMGETDWRKLRLLGGVRWEETNVEATGVLRDQPVATAAQVPDPFRRAAINAGRPFTRSGRYENFFPSVHATYRISPNLQARASYSTGISRPGYNNIVPNSVIDDVNDVITTSNPALKPQTADSYDLSLEYFTEPAGVISVGLFRKDIRDYITNTLGTVEADNDFGPQYAGYRLSTPGNTGSAQVQGLELNVVRQLNFIPRAAGLFTFKGNLTLLRAEGNFGGAARLSSGQVPDFIPRAWNLVADYSKGKFSALVRYNYQAAFLANANANPNLATRNPARAKLDVNFNFRWHRAAGFFLAIDNLTAEPIYTQIGTGSRVFTGNVWAGSRRFNLGVQGRF